MLYLSASAASGNERSNINRDGKNEKQVNRSTTGWERKKIIFQHNFEVVQRKNTLIIHQNANVEIQTKHTLLNTQVKTGSKENFYSLTERFLMNLISVELKPWNIIKNSNSLFWSRSYD